MGGWRRVGLTRLRTIGVTGATVAILTSMVVIAGAGPSASAASPLAITLSSTPTSVATGQAVAFRVTVTNNGTAAASGITLTDSFNGVGLGQMTAPATTSDLGSCSYASPTETCTVPSLGAGQVWNLTITLAVTSAPGAAYSDAATVSGTESSAPVTATASTTATSSQTLASGFVQTKLAGGLTKPIFVVFAPNGDMYVGEEGGAIMVYRGGKVLTTPLGTIPNVCDQGEGGLIGMALDPNYATNGYVYISYVYSATSCTGAAAGHARLSRFTVVNGALSPPTEKVYLQGNQVQQLHHPGNTVKIGPDGKLWWSVGDNVPAISNAEALTNIYGKMLRFNLDGSIPADNPFVGVSGAIPFIYAYGLRNPFRFTFLPTGKAMTEDTGSSFWEGMDTIQPGGNFGWPFKEGNCGSCGYLNPAYAYGHDPTDGAASAIAAYSGSTFPKAYAGVVFLGDYNRRTIDAVSFDATYQTQTSDTVFDTNAGTVADIEQGPDGNLYFVSIFEGSVSEISAPGPFLPTATATATPSAGVGPLAVQFSSAGSTDAYARPLTYSWNFGDGSPVSTSANPTHTYVAAGTFTATLTVSNGALTGTSTTPVVVGHAPPAASITAPSNYNAGATVAFSGTATEPSTGALPASDYTWQVDFHSNGVVQPSYFAEVAHPFYGPTTGATAGSVTIPTDPSQVPGSFYRITLKVTDSLGLQTVVTKDLQPNLTSWSAGTNVAGAGYWVDGMWETGPYSTQDVVGTVHVLTALAPARTIGGVRYRFASWADGSALTDTFTAGSGSTTHTADYEPVQVSPPSPWQSGDIGAPISAGTADYSPSDQSFYVDGGGADVFGVNDQSHYVYQSLVGDGTIVARVRYQTDSSSWAKAGVMIRQSAVAGSPFVDALVAPDVSPSTPNINGVGCDANGCLSPLPPIQPAMGYGARMQASGSKSVTPASYPAGFTEPNKWIKLQKSGNNFTSWMSSDGAHWTQIGVTTVAMTGPVTVGLFDTSHNIGQDSTVAFDKVQVTGAIPPPPPGPLPSPWVDTDVGAPAIAGSAGYGNGVFTVNGAGADIYGTNDQFNYVNQPANLSGTIIARVTSQTNTSSNAKAGIMFKQSTAAGSPYFLIATSPAGVVKVQYNFHGSVTESTFTFPNVWMKLSWSSTTGTFVASLSSDGATWTPVLTKALALTNPATVGLFECSHNANALGTATFDNVGYSSP